MGRALHWQWSVYLLHLNVPFATLGLVHSPKLPGTCFSPKEAFSVGIGNTGLRQGLEIGPDRLGFLVGLNVQA